MLNRLLQVGEFCSHVVYKYCVSHGEVLLGCCVDYVMSQSMYKGFFMLRFCFDVISSNVLSGTMFQLDVAQFFKIMFAGATLLYNSVVLVAVLWPYCFAFCD
jgi:hypothetical protein